jgi:hypothetical protein
VSYWTLYWLQWHAWQNEEAGFAHAQCKYGPRVVVRCTKPINKGDEVFITYIDLLQTRVLFSFHPTVPVFHNRSVSFNSFGESNQGLLVPCFCNLFATVFPGTPNV